MSDANVTARIDAARSITGEEASRLWSAGNNDGRGYAPYTDVPGADTIAAAVAAAEADGGEVILTPDDGITVLLMSDGGLMGIGDSSGPWAVDLRIAR
jgi:hypothetical protein